MLSETEIAEVMAVASSRVGAALETSETKALRETLAEAFRFSGHNLRADLIIASLLGYQFVPTANVSVGGLHDLLMVSLRQRETDAWVGGYEYLIRGFGRLLARARTYGAASSNRRAAANVFVIIGYAIRMQTQDA